MRRHELKINQMLVFCIKRKRHSSCSASSEISSPLIDLYSLCFKNMLRVLYLGEHPVYFKTMYVSQAAAHSQSRLFLNAHTVCFCCCDDEYDFILFKIVLLLFFFFFSEMVDVCIHVVSKRRSFTVIYRGQKFEHMVQFHKLSGPHK